MIPRMPRITLVVATTALLGACGPQHQASVYTAPPSSAGIGPTKPAPTPTLSTLGVPDAPSFGPGVGAGINDGIGIEPSKDLIP